MVYSNFTILVLSVNLDEESCYFWLEEGQVL